MERNASHITLEDFAASKPSWEDITEMSLAMAYKFFDVSRQRSEPPKESDEDIVLDTAQDTDDVDNMDVDIAEDQDLQGTAEEQDVSDDDKDQVFENAKQKHTMYFFYLELSDACRNGDIGRLEDCLIYWIAIFQAVKKHKYATLLTRFLLDLRFLYPDELREAIRLNWLCNPIGREDTFRAVDWLVEVNNCATKVTFAGSGSNKTKEQILKQSNLIELFTTTRKNVVGEYHLVNLTSRHARPDMTSTHAKLARHIEEHRTNVRTPGRKADYIIPNLITKGISELQKTNFMDRTHLSEEGAVEDEAPAAMEESDLSAI